MSDSQFTHADLERILVERIGLAETDVPDDLETSFAELGLDSLAVVEVQLALQQRYGFAIADADAGVMTTFAETIDYVSARLAAAEVV